ncbi:DUF1328 domain-containing protein [Pigmentiphaga sp.]|uniref:DUF1328 domain-containing protein n=1 Tax=Pigmentiphaga sp. TaxID=1977564 RepID=UPI00128E53D1|nr:DUF1328 domain-containing protein [Pigmentiphaga sp.]MPS28009.1 DUF1328 domain-containing protein [Alcaligenaceae bacterium SAGV5]MPS54654.1 DUF1328 domain-containing protein [Alcaligenaceae bacterium SAGV3]MPT56973.1 DUF1328 domain-containing protein [Alcaligenaceae bacterium]
MLRWATIFFVIPLLAAVVGISDFAASAAHIAIALFLVSLGAFLATFFVDPPDGGEEDCEGEWSL